MSAGEGIATRLVAVWTFHSDIASWIAIRIEEKVAERRAHYDKPRTQAKTKARLEQEIADIDAELAATGEVEKFVYGTGSSCAEGILDPKISVAARWAQL